MNSRVLAEVAEPGTWEELRELAKKVMEIMEFVEDEFAESYVRGALAMSKTITKSIYCMDTRRPEDIQRGR